MKKSIFNSFTNEVKILKLHQTNRKHECTREDFGLTKQQVELMFLKEKYERDKI